MNGNHMSHYVPANSRPPASAEYVAVPGYLGVANIPSNLIPRTTAVRAEIKAGAGSFKAMTPEKRAKIDALLASVIPLIKGGMAVDQAIFTAGGDEGIKEIERNAAAGAQASKYFLARLAAGVAPSNGSQVSTTSSPTGTAMKMLPYILGGGGLLLILLRKR